MCLTHQKTAPNLSLLRKYPIPLEYLGAFKAGHRPSARDFIDEDLAWQLLELARNGCSKSREALLWLTRFNNEFHKNVIKKGDSTALHGTEALRMDCSRKNDARKRDAYTMAMRVPLTDAFSEFRTALAIVPMRKRRKRAKDDRPDSST